MTERIYNVPTEEGEFPSPTDHTLPEGQWAFDEGVTAVFDDMLERSIPQYAVMRAACLELASRYRQERTAIVDLGCSRGEAMAELVRRFGAHNRFVGVEVSEPMLAACRERFKGMLDCGVVDVRNLDLRTDFPREKASVILSVLTLQFTPIEYRPRIVRECYKHLEPGGALILVEKVLGRTAEIDEALVGCYLDMKRANGYSEDEIQRKRLALEGVLVPVTAAMNEEFLHGAGFRQVDCFWRWMNFAGWLAIKED